MIRRVEAADYSAVADLLVQTYVDAGYIPSDSAYVSILRDTAHRAEQAEVLVYELDGVIVGTVTITVPGSAYAEHSLSDELEFRMLAVSPDARGKGVGTALVQYVLDRGVTGGYPKVVLATIVEMAEARRIYDRLGFVPSPSRNRHKPRVLLEVLVWTA